MPLKSLLGRLKCRLGLHTGRLECHNGWLFLQCRRCGQPASPARPEMTERMYGDSDVRPQERDS